MAIAADLKAILADKALAPQKTNASVRLREKGVMEVEMVKPPSDLAAIVMEKLGRLSGIREGKWKRTCDYLLVYSQEGKDRAVFVELKKTLNEDRRRAMEQLRRSLPFLEYLRSVCEIHFGAGPASRGMEVRYLLIGERRRTRFDKKQSVNADPAKNLENLEHENIMVTTFTGSRVCFDLLVSQ